MLFSIYRRRIRQQKRAVPRGRQHLMRFMQMMTTSPFHVWHVIVFGTMRVLRCMTSKWNFDLDKEKKARLTYCKQRWRYSGSLSDSRYLGEGCSRHIRIYTAHEPRSFSDEDPRTPALIHNDLGLTNGRITRHSHGDHVFQNGVWPFWKSGFNQ